MDAKTEKFNAPAAAAGYIFQARVALAEALKFAYLELGVEISIEKFDDVSFEMSGEPFELLQTKHHIRKVGDLTDASPDLWKTLRVWSEKVKSDPSLPSRVRFALVTTAVAPNESAAAHLRPAIEGGARNIEVAASRLSAVIATSKNSALTAAFSAFSALAPEMQYSLLSAVDVLDKSPSLIDLSKIIDERLKMIAPRGKASVAREQIEGWWWARVAKILQEPETGSISVLELEARLDDIREVMKRDALPVDMDQVEPDDAELQALDEMRFVQQLRMLRLGLARTDLAKRDFYRASTQRSRWTRESLLFDGEVARFEKTLIEEWQPRFHAMCDTLGSKAQAEQIRKAGQALYYWVETEARFTFRNQSHRFLSVGSYNMLADDLRVGWHRDYTKKISKQDKV